MNLSGLTYQELSKKKVIDFIITDEEQALQDLRHSLLSMENLDRTSPELWPEKSK